MTGNRNNTLLMLWLFAAGLSLVAAGVDYFKTGNVNWLTLLFAGFGVMMGYLNWARRRRKPDAG